MAKKGEASIDEVEECAENESMVKLILFTIGGLAAIVLGSNVTINSATALSRIFGLSEAFIGLTVVAFGTSLPELITCITAALKGKDDIAIGNIIGSNVFNILFVIGTTGLITTVPFDPSFIVDAIVAILAPTLLLLCVLKNKKISRFGGGLMFVSYIAYFIYLYANTM